MIPIRLTLPLAVVAGLLVLPLGGCAWPRRVLVINTAPTAVVSLPPATVTVKGEVVQAVAVPVSDQGTTLRQAVEAVKVTGNAAEQTPGSVYVQFSRPEGDYYVALSLVMNGGAGNIHLAPADTVRIVTWEMTDLARGLKEVKRVVPPLPTEPQNIVSVLQWITVAFQHREVPAYLGVDISDTRLTEKDLLTQALGAFDAQLEAKKVIAEGEWDQLKPTAKEQETVESLKAWLVARLVSRLAGEVAKWNAVQTKVKRVKDYEQDWKYLNELYQDRAVVSTNPRQLAAIDATFQAVTEPKPLDEASLRLTPPTNAFERNAGGHPTFNTYFTRLNELPDQGVVRLVRAVNGKRTEFILELIATPTTWELSKRDLEQDYHRLHDMLIFDGDELEVTTLNRIAPVVEATVLDVLTLSQKAKAVGK